MGWNTEKHECLAFKHGAAPAQVRHILCEKHSTVMEALAKIKAGERFETVSRGAWGAGLPWSYARPGRAWESSPAWQCSGKVKEKKCAAHCVAAAMRWRCEGREVARAGTSLDWGCPSA